MVMLVISGKAADYLRAAEYLSKKDSAILSDPNFAIYYETDIITQEHLQISKQECQDLAEIFHRFGSNPGRYHDYYDIKALEDTEVSLMMSIGEYTDSIFDED